MATKYQPAKQSAGANFDWGSWFSKLIDPYVVAGGAYINQFADNPVSGYANPESFILQAPYGYSGTYKFTPTADNYILTNPWGVQAANTLGQDAAIGFGSNSNTAYLAPGQSINLKTGALSDPNLHAATAYRLTQEANVRAVKSQGLEAATQGSARNKPTTLSALDDLYFPNARTEVTKPKIALTGLAEASQGGLDSSSRQTLLGMRKPTTTTTTTVRNPYA